MDNAFVTGGSRGIGRAIVLKFAELGIGCAFTYRSRAADADETIRLAHEINPDVPVKAYELELLNRRRIDEVVEQAIEQLGPFRILVHNAGIVQANIAAFTSDEEWDEVIATNLTAPFLVTRAFLSHFLGERKGGRIIAISSITQHGASGQAGYAASKAGLVGFMKSIAKEYAPKGITTNIVSPGFIETEMTASASATRLKDYWVQFCPAKRTGLPEDITGIVAFLASNESSFVNGQVIHVSGGLDVAP